MSGIIAGFGTPEPVSFKEKGCDTEFSARFSGALYIDSYDEAAYGTTEAERRSNLAIFALEKLTEHISHWHEEDRIMRVDGERVLEQMLTDDLAELGITGSASAKNIRITDEVKDLYQKQIMDPYDEEKSAQFNKKLEAADEPHGPLREFCYSLSSHGMMAGSSSGNSRSVSWKEDGTVIYRTGSYGGGRNTEFEYKITPETAKKISDFVTDSHLAALSKMDIPTVTMFDNFTSATISMVFDDRSVGGDAYNSFHLNCGPAHYTFKSLEDTISELLKECEETGECIKSEVRESENAFGGFFNVLGMGMDPAKCTPLADFDGMKQAQENMTKAAIASTAASGGNWTCKCGSVNTGKFCPECGQPRV